MLVEVEVIEVAEARCVGDPGQPVEGDVQEAGAMRKGRGVALCGSVEEDLVFVEVREALGLIGEVQV